MTHEKVSGNDAQLTGRLGGIELHGGPVGGIPRAEGWCMWGSQIPPRDGGTQCHPLRDRPGRERTALVSGQMTDFPCTGSRLSWAQRATPATSEIVPHTGLCARSRSWAGPLSRALDSALAQLLLVFLLMAARALVSVGARKGHGRRGECV